MYDLDCNQRHGKGANIGLKKISSNVNIKIKECYAIATKYKYKYLKCIKLL